MFHSASSFNQDLSSWKVPLIASMPIGFNTATIHTGTPQWGVSQ